VASYRTSPLAAEAPGVAETVSRWSGQTMGGRVPAFMGLAQRTGGVYFENPPSLLEGLRQTGLDYTATLDRVQAVVMQDGISESGEPVEIPTYIDIPDRRVVTMRFDDGRLVPVNPTLSPKYHLEQPREALAWGQEIIDQGEGALVALGAYGKPLGSKLYAAFALEGIKVGGEDPVGLFLTIITGVDGYTARSARLAPVRFACTNETPLYFGKRAPAPSFSMRHTSGMADRVAEARQALDLAVAYREEFAVQAERALAVKMNENKAITYWRQVFGVPAQASEWKPRQATIAQPREDELVALLGGDTCQAGRGTAWAAFNALTEYVDHGNIKDAEKLATRQLRILEGATDEIKQRAWDLALAN
jgi:phage/plasmid-like protein (TIGR03299 family)